jgi:hypothetical protein
VAANMKVGAAGQLEESFTGSQACEVIFQKGHIKAMRIIEAWIGLRKSECQIQK